MDFEIVMIIVKVCRMRLQRAREKMRLRQQLQHDTKPCCCKFTMKHIITCLLKRVQDSHDNIEGPPHQIANFSRGECSVNFTCYIRSNQIRTDHSWSVHCKPHQNRSDQTRSDQIRQDKIKTDQTWPAQNRRDQVRPEIIKSNQMKAHEITSDQTRPGQTRSDQNNPDLTRTDKTR